ncbi:MAG TPA: thioredoxin domain-containing protein [Vicinamibacterales bacterium]|nr:thioredoxin domain-containing protein [Vicinamibacterales bacterium]
MNRLAAEHSPYLLQHADNPVDWFPWGDDAFSKARLENKPIFLSIGYSTCHWCHVMAHESFENADVAAVLNSSFVPIKVDREERPDVDRVYMTFVQATTGSGGWPMSVWLTPDLKPFYGGTYFPPSSRWGRPGFVDILGEIARVWQSEPAKVQQSAESLTSKLRGVEHATPSGANVPGIAALDRIVAEFRNLFDHVHGGFGGAPKFPRPSELLFLFRYWALQNLQNLSNPHLSNPSNDPRDMALVTLRAMAFGGMCDHIGGGFHRYSVDEQWRVPHFEKMLYDQAQLVIALLEASQASGDPFYANVAEDTLQYVMREMTDEAGGFFSAEDADSVPPEQADEPHPHASEGAFYLWRADEVDALLGADAPMIRRRFGIEQNGNAPADPQQEFVGKNILYVAQSIEQIARQTERSPDDVQRVLRAARLKMFEARVSRPHPHLDDKVLTAWNGLMIAAFARAARVVSDTPAYLHAARRAATFIREQMWNDETSTLLRRYRRGDASIDAYAEDYAYLIYGVLELFQADPDVRWLDWAQTLQRRQNELFWDEMQGGWFSTTGRDSHVLLRMKEDYDGAEPTASAVSVMNLLTLSHLLDEPIWAEQIEKTFAYFGSRLEQIGRAVPMMAAALATSLAGIRQVVVVGEDGELGEVLKRRYLPFTIQLAPTEEQRAALAAKLPVVVGMQAVDGRAAAYVCRDFTCQAPVTDRAALERELA